MRFIVTVASVAAATVVVCGASASTPLTKGQYEGKLRAANAVSARADNAANAALGSRTSTAAQVKERLRAMGVAHVAVGKEFAALVPPKAAAKPNADFAHAEIVFGRQNEAIAAKLPATKAALMKYLQSLKPPSGGNLLDRAIAELHAAGFRI